MEQSAYEYLSKIEELGGMVAAVKRNFPQSEIADASWRYQTEVDEGKRLVVGVNSYENEDESIEILNIDAAFEPKQIERLRAARAQRDSSAVESSLAELKSAAADPDRNLMPPLIGVCPRLRNRGRDGSGASGGLRNLLGVARFLRGWGSNGATSASLA